MFIRITNRLELDCYVYRAPARKKRMVLLGIISPKSWSVFQNNPQETFDLRDLIFRFKPQKS